MLCVSCFYVCSTPLHTSPLISLASAFSLLPSPPLPCLSLLTTLPPETSPLLHPPSLLPPTHTLLPFLPLPLAAHLHMLCCKLSRAARLHRTLDTGLPMGQLRLPVGELPRMPCANAMMMVVCSFAHTCAFAMCTCTGPRERLCMHECMCMYMIALMCAYACASVWSCVTMRICLFMCDDASWVHEMQMRI